MSLRALGPLLAALVCTGCAGFGQSEDANSDAQAAARTPIVVINAGDMPPRCAPGPLARTVRAFIATFNAGDIGRARAYFSEPAFQWYAVNGEPGRRDDLTRAHELETLAGYLRARAAKHERLSLRELRVNFAKELRELDGAAIPPTLTAAVELRLERTADDFRASHPRHYHGKALVACEAETILMWNIGTEEGPPTRLCPPSLEAPRGAILACAGAEPPSG